MDWLNLMPLPVALGMVLYVNHILEKHEKNCPVHKELSVINKKIDLILDHLLNNRG